MEVIMTVIIITLGGIVLTLISGGKSKGKGKGMSKGEGGTLKDSHNLG